MVSDGRSSLRSSSTSSSLLSGSSSTAATTAGPPQALRLAAATDTPHPAPVATGVPRPPPTPSHPPGAAPASPSAPTAPPAHLRSAPTTRCLPPAPPRAARSALTPRAPRNTRAPAPTGALRTGARPLTAAWAAPSRWASGYRERTAGAVRRPAEPRGPHPSHPAAVTEHPRVTSRPGTGLHRPGPTSRRQRCSGSNCSRSDWRIVQLDDVICFSGGFSDAQPLCRMTGSRHSLTSVMNRRGKRRSGINYLAIT
mmetsp:Transcript_36086/g.90099  ORF Transcript_36086/g.90099 Transcript_36086/m.90099 type:complete len:254 (+) Transcript_36086:2953-3714(+)